MSCAQFSSVSQSCPTVCDRMDCSMPGLPIHHQPPELAQTHVHWVGDAIQPSHPLSSPSPPTFNLSQHQGLQLLSTGPTHLLATTNALIKGVLLLCRASPARSMGDWPRTWYFSAVPPTPSPASWPPVFYSDLSILDMPFGAYLMAPAILSPWVSPGGHLFQVVGPWVSPGGHLFQAGWPLCGVVDSVSGHVPCEGSWPAPGCTGRLGGVGGTREHFYYKEKNQTHRNRIEWWLPGIFIIAMKRDWWRVQTLL